MNEPISTSTVFDFIEVEYFERRLYEIVKASTSKSKQEELEKYESQVSQLKLEIKQRCLANLFQKLQWRGVLQTASALRDVNYKLIVDTQRSQLHDQIKSFKSKTPLLEEKKQTLLYKNLQLESKKQALSTELERLNEKLSQRSEAQVECKIHQVERYHGVLVRHMGLMKQQMQGLMKRIDKTKLQMTSLAQIMSEIRQNQTRQMTQQKAQLNRHLHCLQISNSIIKPEANRVKQANMIDQRVQNTHIKYGELKLCIKNKDNILSELKLCIENEITTRNQLAEYVKELKQMELEDISKYIVTKPNGELVYQDDVVADDLVGNRPLEEYSDLTKDGHFILENYLTFDED
ncbi:hypothetical protein M8J77_008222 [Diaphorina citri]|nr:hypothetical protein M8J77_008222 [Diaphorina citri]